MTRKEAICAIKGWDFLDEKEREAIETLIPELKKDDRERIKENCIHFLELQKSRHASTVEIDECIDWLKDLVPPKWLYRLEYKDGTCGLWYNGEGKWCFEQGIGSLIGCKTKDLPMNHDERYKQGGRDWFSSCSNKEDLLHWYSLEDAEELIKKGFVFTRYLATEYHEYENETVFIKESSLVREEIDIFELFGKTKPMFKEGDNEGQKKGIQIVLDNPQEYGLQKIAEWSEEDEIMFRKAIITIDNVRMNTKSSEYYEGISNWLESLKDRVQPQQQEWSEEDASLCARIQGILSVCKSHSLLSPYLYKEMCDWLKSLKNRYTWKPSEEQLSALRDAAIYIKDSMFPYPKDILIDLYKKLKDE